MMKEIDTEMRETDTEMTEIDIRRRDMAEMRETDTEMTGIEMIEEIDETETRNGTEMTEDVIDPDLEADPGTVTEVVMMMTGARTETSPAETRMTRLI